MRAFVCAGQNIEIEIQRSANLVILFIRYFITTSEICLISLSDARLLGKVALSHYRVKFQISD